jgi:hypothetical protein
MKIFCKKDIKCQDAYLGQKSAERILLNKVKYVFFYKV